jgi:hypothetical protein
LVRGSRWKQTSTYAGITEPTIQVTGLLDKLTTATRGALASTSGTPRGISFPPRQGPSAPESRMIRWFAILSLLQLVAFWKILGRMGYPPWLAIMASIPLVNLILFYYVALNPWPREGTWNGPGGGEGDARF